MTRSIGRPDPDCAARRHEAAARRSQLATHAETRGAGTTSTNGEETRFGAGYPLNFHKSLPHDVLGNVHGPSYEAMVAAVTGHAEGALETLPVGRNRTGSGDSATDPRTWTADPPGGFRGLTSPLTGHVYETEGADAGALGIAPAPALDSDELAAEMAEVYAMALLRDVSFVDIEEGTSPAVQEVVGWLGAMPWLDGSHVPTDAFETRRLATRHPVTSGGDLFRGSTAGAATGHWLSQFLLMGNSTDGGDFRQPGPAGAEGQQNSTQPSFKGLLAQVGREDGYILFGTQVIDQRSIVARPGVDHVTTWAAWLDCQNGVDFNGRDQFLERRRYLTTPRDIATYVHFDALYQAYLNACLLMLADGGSFPKDPGLPESTSRTRTAFASFGGPYALSLVTEVATRALKAVWRQKWMHHRRTRPEVVAGLLTLHANGGVPAGELADQLQRLRDLLPAGLLDAVADHNAAQNAADHALADAAGLPADFPTIADASNFLLPLAFPEGSPTHPAYGAGHATVAGACVTVLKALFDTVAPDGTPRPWPEDLTPFVVEEKVNEGGELVPDPAAPALTLTGELDKLAANISIARNMAGVHYYTDYYESARLGERIATSIIEEQLGMFREPVTVRFQSFDGELVEVRADGATASVRVTDTTDGQHHEVPSDAWYGRYGS